MAKRTLNSSADQLITLREGSGSIIAERLVPAATVAGRTH